jgi:transposase
MKKNVIGVDVSKEKLDFCLLENGKIVKEWIVANSTETIKNELSSLKIDLTKTIVCAEYTGQYTYPLCCACEEITVDLWLENPAQIKFRSGVQRGKNDKIDARRIAAYAVRFQDEMRLFSLPEKNIASIKLLISERDMYVCDKGKYQGQITDQKRFMSEKDYARKAQRLQKLIAELDETIALIEKHIEQLIKSDESLNRQHNVLCSVDGIGKQTALKMIVSTNAFENFKDPRKFCCYAGIAPFKYTSGSSQHSKSRVSQRADKSIKSLLHMAALSVIAHKKGELYEYFLRKVAEGKNKMTVINAIRTKLVYRMFAVVKNNKLYEKNYAFVLA